MLSDLIPLFGGVAACAIVTSVLRYWAFRRSEARAQERHVSGHLQAWRAAADRLEQQMRDDLPRVETGQLRKSAIRDSAGRLRVAPQERAVGGIVRGPHKVFYMPHEDRADESLSLGLSHLTLANVGITGAEAVESIRLANGGCPHEVRHPVRLSTGELVAWICASSSCGGQILNEAWIRGDASA